jgi:glucans biosynthesis protein C
MPKGSRTWEPRWHALDALRAAAMLSVLLAHSSLAYIRYNVPCLLWAVHDRSTHLVFDILFHWTRIAVPLFFTLSGFFSVLLYEAKGRAGFLKDRARRILVPLLVGILTVLPLSLWIWAYGWFQSGRCSDLQFLKMVFLDPEIRAQRYGPGHLWFIEYTSIYIIIYYLIRSRLARSGGPYVAAPCPGRREAVFFAPATPFVLAAPTALLLWLSHEPNGLDALLNRRNCFAPDPLRLIFYGLFFAFGVRLHRVRFGLGFLGRRAWVLLALSLLTFALRFLLLRRDLTGQLDPSWVPVEALLGALTCWLSLYALLGLVQRYVRHETRVIRYLADASYWVYWSHFPITGLVQIHLSRVSIPLGLKFLLVVAVTLGWTLASYQTLVRYTGLGRWLHGPRQRGAVRLFAGPHPHRRLAKPQGRPTSRSLGKAVNPAKGLSSNWMNSPTVSGRFPRP